MSTSAAGQALIPQPPATVTALRQAVAQISPAALPAFTRELDQAADQSRQGSDLAPLQRFIAQWATYVHIQRQPETAAELRRWEDTAATGDAAQARRAAAEIGRILDAAHAAVTTPPRWVPTGAGSTTPTPPT
ncbi:DUF6247 family protein [Streptomyces xanthophaeus]|uniref:DUF6247 family protein n=1 Tax=Streptomyces xanthophaeus TaxID=67385 RepID=UPI0038674AE3|nr:DUF6247 family protein [Streptomyces xanthophaeus]WST60689.1 DUF6247 family protein [Streptomyces xanthophaeus]